MDLIPSSEAIYLIVKIICTSIVTVALVRFFAALETWFKVEEEEWQEYTAGFEPAYKYKRFKRCH